MGNRRHKTLEKVVKQEEELHIEETKMIRCDVPMSVYRTLTKLAADSQPFVKVNEYSCNVLTEHVSKQKKG